MSPETLPEISSPVESPLEAPSPRTAANRANAQLSTGPRTQAGKAKIRFNALQHGMYAGAVVLPHENREAFESLCSTLTARYAPQTEDEQKLVATLGETEWRLSRIGLLESGILAIGTADHFDSIQEKYGPMDDPTAKALAQSAAFLEHSRQLDQLSRHEARLRRLRDQTLAGLQHGPERSPHPRQVQQEVEPTAEPAGNAAEPDLGFVPNVPAPAAQPDGFVPTVAHLASAAEPEPEQKRYPNMPKFTGPMRKQHRKEWIRREEKRLVAANQR